MIFKNAFVMMRYRNILPIMKKDSTICREKMKEKLTQIHKTSDFESSFECSPSHIRSSRPKYCYTTFYQGAMFLA